jgi:hypothetical protein
LPHSSRPLSPRRVETLDGALSLTIRRTPDGGPSEPRTGVPVLPWEK